MKYYIISKYINESTPIVMGEDTDFTTALRLARERAMHRDCEWSQVLQPLAQCQRELTVSTSFLATDTEKEVDYDN